MGLRLRRYHPFWHDQSAPNAAVADKRLTSLTLAADTFSSLAVSRTPRPSSNAERIRCTWNGVVLGLPRRLPDDRARSSPAITRSLIIARSNSENTPSMPNSIERLLVEIEVDVAGS
jgi:hypothetical protein